MKTGTEREAEIIKMLEALFAARKTALAKHRVVLFGSRAQGNAKQRSDFDLGVDGDEPLGIQQFFEIEEALEGLPTLYSFDWVDLAKTSNRFREEVLKTVRVLYDGTSGS